MIARIFQLSPAAVVFFPLPPSLPLCVVAAGRPGSGVLPHQQYPCWRRPKGESTCLRTIRSSWAAHSAPRAPTETLPSRSGETATTSRIVWFASVVCWWAGCRGSPNPPIPTEESSYYHLGLDSDIKYLSFTEFHARMQILLGAIHTMKCKHHLLHSCFYIYGIVFTSFGLYFAIKHTYQSTVLSHMFSAAGNHLFCLTHAHTQTQPCGFSHVINLDTAQRWHWLIMCLWSFMNAGVQ